MMKLFIKFSKTLKDEKTDYRLKSSIRAAILTTLKCERFPYDCEVSVSFCDNAHIGDLNLRHRGIDKATDVLSFPM